MKADNEYLRSSYKEYAKIDEIENCDENYAVWLEDLVLFLLNKINEENFKKEYLELFGERIK